MDSSGTLPERSFRPTLAIVDLDAIAFNFQAIRGLLSAGTQIYAIVKADAYGHGAVPVSRELEALGVQGFGVATVEEGLELRRAGIRTPVLVLGVCSSGIEEALEADLTPVVYSPGSAARVSEAARRIGKRVSVHLKLDTGMGRLGIARDQWLIVMAELRQNPWIRLEGVLSHLAAAESDPGFTELQFSRFDEGVLEATRLWGEAPQKVHLANSAGILGYPERTWSGVRPGIMLYGVRPDPKLGAGVEVRPAMTFRTSVLAVRAVPAGTPLSYGGTFRTRRDSRIAVLPVGYADGYRRDFSNRARVLVRGSLVPVVGTVTMDLTLADVTDLAAAAEGDEVVLFGRGAGGHLPVEDLARSVGTIPYELLCAVSRRVPRIYLKGGKALRAS
ncbi:MAG: alanine racemase [bacterium]